MIYPLTMHVHMSLTRQIHEIRGQILNIAENRSKYQIDEHQHPNSPNTPLYISKGKKIFTKRDFHGPGHAYLSDAMSTSPQHSSIEH